MYTKNSQCLISILQSYAPTGKEQQFISDWFNQVETRVHKEFDTKKAANNHMIGVLCGAIYDGINYGNWPWVVAGLHVAEMDMEE